MKNHLKYDKAILTISIVSLIYFGILGYLTYNPSEITFIGVIRELATIPLLLFVVFGVFYTLFRVFKKRSNAVIISALVINLITIAYLATITIK